jgi:hypothetical protein
MNESDMYWDGPTGPADSPHYEDGAEDDESSETADSSEARDYGTASADNAPEDALQEALQRVVLEDTPALRQALEAAGFSSSEANRLIFERRRPRAEGLTRN